MKLPTRLFIINSFSLWGLGYANVKTTEKEDLNSHKQISSSQLGTLEKKKTRRHDYEPVIDASYKKVLALKLELGIPGLTISVARRGESVWRTAFGFCDVENQLPCEPDASMRIASISKPLFVATIVAPLIEQYKLDLKSSIHNYLKPDEFPKQQFNGKEYDITIEQLLTHTSGITHYSGGDNPTLRPIGSKQSVNIYQDDQQFNRMGFYQRQTYRSVIDALEPFKTLSLVDEPGSGFHYTTYGYTLLSAVIQKYRQIAFNSPLEQIEDYWINTLHKDWQMNNTFLDQDERIISNRARYYLRARLGGGLINAPYQDSSVKWAGGGIVSTTDDIVKFANALIDCYKERCSSRLKRETIISLWKKNKNNYGLGFGVSTDISRSGEERLVVHHSGSALGASSILIIYPESEIVVAILANLGNVNLKPLGIYIADEFDKVDEDNNLP